MRHLQIAAILVHPFDYLCRGDLLEIPHKVSHAPSTPSCVLRPRTVKLNRIQANSIAEPVMFFQGEFFSGFQPHTTPAYGRDSLPPPRRKRGKKSASVAVVLWPPHIIFPTLQPRFTLSKQLLEGKHSLSSVLS
ncbi:hypothetical protein EVAR_48738_1 [Eumeta japonica]|uniref:Uncharacterized protein n=1 Tax=Eumeta variegata TaxID=151549 RepID=A0A4C1YG61_EUMVA|nr:hypothetical protein EVAR_48738_1 [Eumeta japonica]